MLDEYFARHVITRREFHVLELRYTLGLSINQTMLALGVSRGTVRVLEKRALQKIALAESVTPTSETTC